MCKRGRRRLNAGREGDAGREGELLTKRGWRGRERESERAREQAREFLLCGCGFKRLRLCECMQTSVEYV